MRLRLEVEDQGLLALANADLLLGRILKAAFGDLYKVVPELEIRQAQLAGMSELPLKFSVEKDSCVILTGYDQERAQVLTGLGGRLVIERGFGRGGVGRKWRSRQRWFGSRWSRSGLGGIRNGGI
jgi:hypothetical protein